ncbi:MAG: hypothetical protein KY443_00675 [Actinobacteria bacterium]|nr:hypothetical protein [Actinomycetota bacterium]
MRRTDMRNRLAALAAVSAFAVGLTAVALVAARSGGGSGLQRLPSLAGGRETADMAMAAGGGWSPSVEYVVEGALPALPGTAPAFRLPTDADRGAVRRLAAALGMSGTAVKQRSSYVVDDAGRRLTVELAPGMPWYLSAGCPDAPVSSHGEGVTAAVCTVMSTVVGEPAGPVARRAPAVGSSSAGGSSGSPSGSASASGSPEVRSSAVQPAQDAPLRPPPAEKPEPLVREPRPAPDVPAPPADLPSKEDADRLARALFERLGLGTDTLRLEAGTYSWEAFVSPPVGGLPVVGMDHIVSIGPKGTISGGHGYLLKAKRIGDYPLAGVDVGLARLREGRGVGARPMADAALGAIEPYCPDTADCAAPPPSGPVIVTITGVHLGLQHVADALVPVYVFKTDHGGELAVPAVTDRWLEETSPTRDDDGEPEPDIGHSSGACGVSVSGRGVDAEGGTDDVNAPLTVEVCVEPARAKVGEEVTFTVTVKDPDAEIYDEVCAGPLVVFGDEELVARTMCAHACDAGGRAPTVTERRAGELTRTFTHAYAKPGTYTARFAYRSEPCSTWSSSGQGTATVVVVG